ncbi:MAG: ribosome maturation factor RimM [Acidimicrobiia bacterium]
MSGEQLELGHVGKAHGLKGEVHIVATTNRDERFRPGESLTVDGEDRVIASSRQHQGRWLVRFEGVDDRSAAESLRGALITGEPLGELPPGEVWVHDLVGSEVREVNGQARGTVVAVVVNPAHDLLELDSGVLVPMPFVREVAPGVVTIDPPAGLFD